MAVPAVAAQPVDNRASGSPLAPSRTCWPFALVAAAEAFAAVKCGYKLIQYMACGLRVVASPVGVNAQLVERDRNGLLAVTPDRLVFRVDVTASRTRARLAPGARRQGEDPGGLHDGECRGAAGEPLCRDCLRITRSASASARLAEQSEGAGCLLDSGRHRRQI